MREVPAKLFGFMREMSRRTGADVEAAQEGLALRRVDVDAPGERVDWDDVARFLERAHGHQSQQELEKVGEMYVQTHLWQQLVARVVGTPRLMYEICFGPLCRASFPHLDITVESHADGVRLEVCLPDRFEPSPVFFRATTGELRVMTTLLGRPRARVQADVGPRHGIYEVELDDPMPLDRAVGAARRASDVVASEAIRLVRFAVSPAPGETEGAEPSVLELQREHGLTRMEARVTTRLASGLNVKETAEALGIRISTVRSHLKSAYAKTGTRGQSELIRVVLTGGSRLA